MALLTPKVSPAIIFQNKDKKSDPKDAPIDLNISVNVVSDNSLLPTATPISAIGGSDTEDFSFNQTSFYVVRAGDTVGKVADMYGVSVDTILKANELQKGASLKEGDILLILPFSGVEHTVAKGQTLKSIALFYKVDLYDILLANESIDIDTVLAIGDTLIIPGAEIANEPVVTKPKPKTPTVKGKDLQAAGPSTGSYFTNPVPGARRSRGIKPGHMGVDLAAPTGTPIHAGASGTVIIARKGYNGGFGNYVVIQHSNGTKTLYAHMSELGTSPGAKVSKGETIGRVGSTGKSTGPHVHLEVIGGKNPW